MTYVALGAVMTSEGEIVQPMLVSDSDLYTCPNCGAVYVREHGEDIECNCDERLGEYLCLD